MRENSPVIQVLLVTFPFFALVLAGYVAARRGMLRLDAIPGLNSFVLYFALPFPIFWLIVAVSILLCFERSHDETLKSMVHPEPLWFFWQVLATLLFAVLQGNFVVLMAPLNGVYAWLVPLVGPLLYIGAIEFSILVLILLAGRTLRPYAHDWLSRIAAVMISFNRSQNAATSAAGGSSP